MKKLFPLLLLLSLCLIVPAYAAEDDFVIEDGTLYEYLGSAREIVIPDGVQEISTNAFFENDGISSVKIPDSVCRIGAWAFYGCENLTKIDIPGNLSDIERNAFLETPWYRNLGEFPTVNGILLGYEGPGGCVSIPDGVTVIRTGAFNNNGTLKEVTIPDSVTKIEEAAFASCPNLTKVTLPSSVSDIHEKAFVNTPWYDGLGEFPVVNGILMEYRGAGGDVTIPNHIKSIAMNAFFGREDVTAVTIPESVEEIKVAAFTKCINLTDVTFLGDPPQMVSAFYDTPWYEGLGDFPSVKGYLIKYEGKGGYVKVPGGISEIGEEAFYYDDRLTGIMIPDGVTRIGDRAFQGNINLVQVFIPGSVTFIGEDAFLYDFTLDDQIEGITIYGEAGSYAERYAAEQGIPFVAGKPEKHTQFTDVRDGAYFAQPVEWAVDQGIVYGTSKTSFSPARPCSLAEIITFLWRASERPWEDIENPYEDVDLAEDYYYDAALWAYSQGMVTGTRFNPDTPCTRAMTVQYLWQAAGSPEPETPASFTDVPAGSAYSKAVSWAVEQGITQGTSADTFSPEATCTRGQIVTFLYRALAE